MVNFQPSPACAKIFWLMAAVFFDRSCSSKINWSQNPKNCINLTVFHIMQISKQSITKNFHGLRGLFVEHTELNLCEKCQSQSNSHCEGCVLSKISLQGHHLADWPHIFVEALAHNHWAYFHVSSSWQLEPLWQTNNNNNDLLTQLLLLLLFQGLNHNESIEEQKCLLSI